MILLKNNYVIKKIAKIIKYICLIFFVTLFFLSLITSILALIFMIIKNNGGYCNPFMLKVIEIEEHALKMWENL